MATIKDLLVPLNILLTAVVTVLATFSTCQLQSAEKTLKVVESKIMERESDRKDRESHEKKQLTIYDAVVKSLETSDLKRSTVRCVVGLPA